MAHGRRTRIFIVDDSAVVRSLLRTVISADPSLEVAGTAADGAAALQAVESICPDLVLLDVEMPNIDGLETLRKLRSRAFSKPVMMVSAVTQRGARVTIEALASGASDYVTKPSGQSDRETALRVLAQDLLPKIQALTAPPASPLTRSACAAEQPESIRASATMPSVVVIGVSTGGPAALDVLLSAIPRGFPLPMLIVQHMPELFTGPLAERLNQRCSIARSRSGRRGTRASQGPFTWRVATGTWKSWRLRPPHSRRRFTCIRARSKTTAGPQLTFSFDRRQASSVRPRWLWCSREWVPTASPHAASFAPGAALSWRRTKPRAPSGACRGRSCKPVLPSAFFLSPPSLTRFFSLPAEREARRGVLANWRCNHDRPRM